MFIASANKPLSQWYAQWYGQWYAYHSHVPFTSFNGTHTPYYIGACVPLTNRRESDGTDHRRGLHGNCGRNRFVPLRSAVLKADGRLNT